MPALLVESHAALQLPSDRAASIVVVADTHSRPHPALSGHLTTLRPDAILHAGDIGDLQVLEPLAKVAPLYAVRGNIDTRAEDLPDVIILDLEAGGRSLRLLLTHIAVYGAKLRPEVARRAKAHQATLVVCGHSHVPLIAQHGDITVFNPGSIGPRRFHLPILFGLMEITPSGVQLMHLDAETAQRWRPSSSQ